MTDRHPSFERQVRAALTRLHDLPYLQTHPLGADRGKGLQRRLSELPDVLDQETADEEPNENGLEQNEVIEDQVLVAVVADSLVEIEP